MKKEQFLQKILSAIGGEENIVRQQWYHGDLYLTVRDSGVVNLDLLNNMEEVAFAEISRSRVSIKSQIEIEGENQMAKLSKYDQFIEQIPDLLGGSSNIIFFNHCMTRLRVTVKDTNMVNVEEIKKLPGVVGTQWAGEQFQIVIGQNVADVYALICKKIGLSEHPSVDENLDKKKKKISINTIFDYISGSITPLIPIMVAGGCVKMVVVICEMLHILSAGSNTYVVLNFVGDAAFYFLPVFMGASTAKKFGTNVGLGMLIGAIFIHPSFIAALTEGSLSIFGIPIYNASYSSSILPVFLSVAVMKPVQKFFGKHSPEAIRSIIEPFGTIMVMIPLALCVLGPAGTFLGGYITGGILWLYENVGFVGVAVLCGLWPILVSTGMHTQTVPFMLQSMATLGYDPMVLVTMFIGNISQGAACAAVALKSKDKVIKANATSCGITAAVGGITEPAIFGISVPLKTPLIGSVIGGAIGGAIAGLAKAAVYAMPGSCSFIGIPILFAGGISNFIWMTIAIVAGMIGTFVATFILYKDAPSTVK